LSDATKDNERRLRSIWRWPAALWLLIVIAIAAQQVAFWRAPKLEIDVMALLPDEAHDAVRVAAEQKLSAAATRQVMVLIGSADGARSMAAAKAFSDSVQTSAELIPLRDGGAAGASALAFYQPWRDRLLTADQRAYLRDTPVSTLVEQALARLFAPGSSGGPTSWPSDPLGLWSGWWQSRLGTGVSTRDGVPVVSKDGIEWVVLGFSTRNASFSAAGGDPLGNALDRASDAAWAQVPEARILRTGVPLYAEAAADRANTEINTIGFGSLIAVIALMWLAFRGPRPVLLVTLSLVIGVAAGAATTALVFGEVHLLTLVFGASLVGVAEDYGIHYFALRQGHSTLGRHGLMRFLLPGLATALVTSALAYLALGLAPFPGLRQMAVFSASGLIAAFATVVCWFPWLDRGERPVSALGQAISRSLAHWPRARWQGAGTWLVAGVLAAFSGMGLSRLEVRDNLRTLQNAPAALLAQQTELGGVLGMQSPAQFYLVRGDSAEQVLLREERLKTLLDASVAAGRISGYSAISDWVPSRERQLADAALSAQTESDVLMQVSAVIGDVVVRPAFDAPPLSVDEWLESPVSDPFRARWLGEIEGQTASVVVLHGVGSQTDLKRLADQAGKVSGVSWIDRSADISGLLGHYRQMMTWLLLLGFVAVGIALWFRYRVLAWRALLPSAIAMVLSMAVLGWVAEPFQLFSVLALLLLLGMGVDYGIFLVEHAGVGASWLAVSLGAASTLLAFGLLALSATPALHVFGLTMLIGLTSVWVLSPCFRPGPAPIDDSADRSQVRRGLI